WDENTPIYMDKLFLPKVSLIEKIECFEKFLEELKYNFPKLSEMVIEEAFTAMFGGASSATTTAVLNQVNFGFQFVCHKAGLKTNVVSVNDARSFSFPTYKRLKSNQKEQYFILGKEEIETLYPGLIEFQTKIISKGKDKGKVVYEEWCMDVVDSYIV